MLGDDDLGALTIAAHLDQLDGDVAHARPTDRRVTSTFEAELGHLVTSSASTCPRHAQPPCAARPPALVLHRACAGPRYPVRSRLWSRCHSSPGRMRSMGAMHGSARQSTSPRSTAGAHALRSRSCWASYPRCCRVPRARSVARAWAGHLRAGWISGQPGSAHTCCLAMVSSVRCRGVQRSPHASAFPPDPVAAFARCLDTTKAPTEVRAWSWSRRTGSAGKGSLQPLTSSVK